MELGKYYIDLDHCLGEDFSEYEYNQQGIPLTRFYRKPDWQHNPITICQYGLYHFNKYLRTHNQESREIFLTQTKWLTDHAETRTSGEVVWWYRFDIPALKISAPWISGMAQGQALSVLVRSYQLTQDRRYLETAQEAFEIFKVPVEEGGVISFFPDNKPVIEEYPSPESLVGVLNGFIFSIFGIYDYAIYTDDKKAYQFFFKLIDSLKHNMYRYDCGYWSYYDLKPPLRLASRPYHRIHIEQLSQLYQMTKQEVFKNYGDLWRNYLISKKCNLKWLLRKFYQKLVN